MKVQDDGQTTLTVIEGTVEFGTACGTWPAPVEVKPVLAWLQALGT